MKPTYLIALIFVVVTAVAITACTTPSPTTDTTENASVVADSEEPTRVALGVRAPQHVEVALMTGEQIYDGKGLEAEQVTIVVCGPGSEELLQESELATEVSSFVERGGRIAVCGLTLTRLDIDPDQILTEVEVVDNGFIELLRLQTEGYYTIEL